MKRMILYACALSVIASCENEPVLSPLPRPVDLIMDTEKYDLVMGDELTICFKTKDEQESVNEDFDIRIYAEEGEEDASHLFEDFPHSVEMKKGSSSVSVSLPVKHSGIEGIHEVEISAFSRGYNISGTPVYVSISDFHRISMSLKGNWEKRVVEGDSFVLSADAGIDVTEDVEITISCRDSEKYLKGLPESMMIKAGTSGVESGPVLMVRDEGFYQDISLSLEFTSSSESIPMAADVLVIERVDADVPLGSPVADERHLYDDPSIAFVSSDNLHDVESWAGQSYVEVTPDVTLHPSLSGWKFHNAVEFHYIQSMLYNNYSLGQQHNAGGQDRPHSFWDQVTPKTGRYMTVNNDKYSAICPGGYLRMWAAKDDTQPKGYGVAALYSNKFKNPAGNNSNTAKPMYCHILPGMRIEFRMRAKGELYGFNPAIWLMGNSNVQHSGAVGWPTCGEIDVVEIPVGPVTGKGAWQACHFGNVLQDGKDVYAPSAGKVSGVDPSEWNIYWMEWTDEDCIRLGINGQTNLVVTRPEVVSEGAIWPFDMNANPYGLHLVLTMGNPAPSEWALGYSEVPPSGWDSGFASVSYAASRTDDRTPRMEVDWIRYYISDVYPEALPTTFCNVKFY